jgi:hypothetical protein
MELLQNMARANRKLKHELCCFPTVRVLFEENTFLHVNEKESSDMKRDR